jgi:hypothetical protein
MGILPDPDLVLYVWEIYADRLRYRTEVIKLKQQITSLTSARLNMHLELEGKVVLVTGKPHNTRPTQHNTHQTTIQEAQKA